MSIFALPDEGFSLMGIVNVTPDSFSDGGRFLDPEKAIAHGIRLQKEGAHILDIGGESTRPGAEPVPVEEEIARILPVLQGLRGCGALLSVDTRNAATMEAALDAGADIINDVSALTHDPRSLSIVAASRCGICLMHSQGNPQTMQHDPHYDDVVADVISFLKERVAACLSLWISHDRLLVDPGVGFGKTLEHNIELIKNINNFQRLDISVLLGASRKRFIAGIDRKTGSDDRLGGSIAACLAAFSKGVRHFRVHDVAETRQALMVYKTLT